MSAITVDASASVPARARRIDISDLRAAHAAVMIVAMIPTFLGLFVALPVLGHATWHL